MLPNNAAPSQQSATSRVQLRLLLDPTHSLLRLADSIQWSIFEQELGPLYVEEVGPPALAIRLMVGLHYLKYLFDESDESVVGKCLEHPYWL